MNVTPLTGRPRFVRRVYLSRPTQQRCATKEKSSGDFVDYYDVLQIDADATGPSEQTPTRRSDAFFVLQSRRSNTVFAVCRNSIIQMSAAKRFGPLC